MSKAIDLQSIGVKNMAWYHSDVLEVIANLDKSSCAILGGDVLSLQDGELKHNYDNWHSEQQDAETWQKYAKRSRDESKDYVNNYPDPNDKTIAYVLVFREGV